MKLSQLYYFRVLAEREHLSQTAEEFFISPSALSSSISGLESELGVSLFDRVGRNIRLNANGKRFYAHVTNILDELDNACSELKNPPITKACSVNVLASTHILWENQFSDFISRNPNISFNHSTTSFDELAAGSIPERFDFVITALGDLPKEGFEYEVIVPNDNPILVVYDGHPLASRKEVSLIEAKNESFIALSKNYSSRHYFDTLCDLAGFKPNIIAEGDYSLRAKLVKDRKGITVSTVLGSKSIYLNGLHFIDIIEPVHQRIQAIFWKKGRTLSPEAKALKSFLVSYYKNKSFR